MNAEISYSLAFLVGLTGTFHCLGMCGGLAVGLSVRRGGNLELSSQIAYHTTRIGIYILLGLLGTLLGRVLAQAGMVGKIQGVVMILSGVIIIIIGVRLSLQSGSCTDTGDRVRLHPASRRGEMIRSIAKGFLNGFIPCSLVFSVAVKTIPAATPVEAGLLMLCFGLGTLPIMTLLTSGGQLLCRLNTRGMQSISGVCVVLMGLWTAYEGWVFFDIMRGLAN